MTIAAPCSPIRSGRVETRSGYISSISTLNLQFRTAIRTRAGPDNMAAAASMCRTAVAREGDRRVIIDENAPQDPGAAETFPQMIRSAAKAYGEETAIVLEDDGEIGRAHV